MFGKNLWKKWAPKECCHSNEGGRKMILFFFVLVVLPKIKIGTWWNGFKFFFIKEFMVYISKESAMAFNSTTISTIAATDFFFNLKIGFFVVIHNILEWKNEKIGVTTWLNLSLPTRLIQNRIYLKQTFQKVLYRGGVFYRVRWSQNEPETSSANARDKNG